MAQEAIAAVVDDLVAGMAAGGRRTAVVVPDGTRTGPLRQVAGLIDRSLAQAGAGETTWVVALGTHQPMPAAAIEAHLGPVRGRVINHEWWDPAALVEVGSIHSEELGRVVDVRLNRVVAEAEVVLLCGPVFPHEVVGFSGGNKYLVPGVAGAEIIDATHWLGALITSPALIGTEGTNPVRSMIDRAASLLPGARWCLAMVVEPGGGGLAGCFAGSPEVAWAEAAALSARTHIKRLDRPVRTVLSLMPARYQDLWTAGKGVYKVEPVVVDGGEVIIYAPHITRISVTHGEALAAIGYHTRDYFTGQWDRFQGVPGAVLAHSTHVSGLGTWTAHGGEQRRIQVTLASGIDEATCRAVNLGWRDPASIDVEAWTARAAQDPDLLVVPDAGEVLYRLA